MPSSQISPITALELTMRDTLDGMDDFACGFAFDSTPGGFEILAIAPPEPGELEDCAA